ncbi:MAG: hypothetical protein PGN08_03660 [Sphingomonas taxi]
MNGISIVLTVITPRTGSTAAPPQVATSVGAGGVKLGMPVEKGWVGDTRTPGVAPSLRTGRSVIAAIGAPVRRLRKKTWPIFVVWISTGITSLPDFAARADVAPPPGTHTAFCSHIVLADARRAGRASAYYRPILPDGHDLPAKCAASTLI